MDQPSVISQMLQSLRPKKSPLVSPMFLPNAPLEQQATLTGMQTEMNPMIQQIANHLGLLNMLRNQQNQKVTDLSQAMNY